MKKTLFFAIWMAAVLFIGNGCAGNTESIPELLLNDFPESISAAEPAEGTIIEGTVIKVLDGDTYDLRTDEGTEIRIRMEGIDAPEGGMHYYRVSKNHLKDLIGGKKVIVKINEKEGNRFIADTYLSDQTDVGREMLNAGLAWHYKYFNSYPEFAKAEEEARSAAVGLWEEPDPVPPWIFRRVQRRGIPYKGFDRFRIREYELPPSGGSFTHNKLLLELAQSADSDFMQFRITKNGKNAGEIKLKDRKTPVRVSFADFNMNGSEDLMIHTGKERVYLFLQKETGIFEPGKGWDIDIWKLNKPDTLILTRPEGTPYKGKIKVYGLDENLNPVEKTSFSYH